MKLYSAPDPAPNPRRVRIFMVEKGIGMPEVMLSLRDREHKAEDFRAKNAWGQVPTLELDDGRAISETVAICRYLDGLNPTPPLFGKDAFEQAEVEMWIRRVELTLMTPVGMFWRHAHPYTAHLLTQFKEFGESNRGLYAAACTLIDRSLADGRPFLVGEAYTMADICALTTIDFARFTGLQPPQEAEHLAAWHERVSARPSAQPNARVAEVA
jgi:glutathione S-transferase